MKFRFRSYWILAVSSLFLGAPSPAAADAGAAVVRHAAAVSSANALIAEVRVSLARAARVFVEYDNPLAGRYRTALSDPRAEHVIPIVRLRPQTTYDYTIFVAGGPADAGDEAAAGPGGRFTTGRLPPALAAVPVKVTGRSSQPLILSDYRRGDGLSYFVFRDETGSVVWYYQGDRFRTGAIVRLPGGNFIFVNRQRQIAEITPLGEVVNRFGGRGSRWGIPHHELTVLDDGRVIYPSRELHVFDDSVNGGSAAVTFLVDNLRIWNPANGRVEQVWDAKEAWDILDPGLRLPRPEPQVGGYSWSHVNSVSIGPRGNVIISSHTRNQVLSLSPDFRTIEWQLHGPDSDYHFPNPDDRFYRQHTAAQLPNGNILVFDNGSLRPDSEGGRYSRALELRLDPAAGAAVKVWEYRPDTAIHSESGGSAYRLRNGNTLVNFSRREDSRLPLVVVEADAAGNEVFRFENLELYDTRERFVRYRAVAGGSAIMGETMLRPPAAAAPAQHVETFQGDFSIAVDVAGFRELEAALEGAQPAAGGPFDLYLLGDRLVYAKEPCAQEDLLARFFLHVYPKNRDVLAEHRREPGFGTFGFYFRDLGLRWEGVCLAEATLPDYEIVRIRTGQVGTRGELWELTIAPERVARAAARPPGRAA